MTTDHDLHGYRNGMGPCVCAECASLRKDFTPHPDTARADAAALRRLVMISLRIRDRSRHDLLLIDVDGLGSWLDDYHSRGAAARRLADLTAERDRRRAALAEAERELATLTASAAPAGG